MGGNEKGEKREVPRFSPLCVGKKDVRVRVNGLFQTEFALNLCGHIGGKCL